MAAARARRADAPIGPLSQQSQRDRGVLRPHQGQESLEYEVSIVSDTHEDEIATLLDLVDEVAEIPKALRSGTTVARQAGH